MQAGDREEGLNPARWRGNLEEVLGDPNRIARTVHHRAVAVADAPAFMKQLASVDGMGARALDLAALTAARSGEVRGATRSEFDVCKAVWTIPGARMTFGKDHRVPLSDAAVRVPSQRSRVRDQSAHVFESPRHGPLSDMALTFVMRRMDVDAVPHGFRPTFRDWSAELSNYLNEPCEAALAYNIADKVEAAYRRGELFDRRRQTMGDWAKFLAGRRT